MVKPVKPLDKMHKRINQKAEERIPLGKDVPLWGDLKTSYENLIYAAEATGAQVYLRLNLIRNDPSRSSFIKDKNHLAFLINSLANDIDNYKKRLLEIFNQHKDKTGKPTDENEYMFVLQLHGRYLEQTEIFNNVTQPGIIELSNIFDEIEKEYSKNTTIEVQPEYVEKKSGPVIDAEFN